LTRLNVRAKILLLFLALSLASLAITGYVALFTMQDVALTAETNSLSLGQQVLGESTAALSAAAEDHLIRIASDQAQITNILFEDTESELEILAVQAGTLQGNPPLQAKILSYSTADVPPDPHAVTGWSLAPGAGVSLDSPEFRTLAGMDDLLKGMYDADENLTSVYIATDSGILRTYPWQDRTGTSFDPRTREWFTGAEQAAPGIYWSKPYVDMAGHGLVVTSSVAVATSQGAWVIGSDVTVDVINSAFLNKTLGGKGYAVLIDNEGTIISRPGMNAGDIPSDQPFPAENIFETGDPTLVALGRNMTAGRTGVETVQFGGRESYVAYAPVPALNWSYAVSMPVDQVTAPVEKTRAEIAAATAETEEKIDAQTTRLIAIFSMLFLVLIVIVIVLAAYLAGVITRPVDALKQGAMALGRGDLDYRVAIRTGDEFEELAEAFNRMAADLRQNIDDLRRTTAEKERYTKELEIAKEIQDTFLPECAPVIPGFGIAAVTIPAMEIGGDLYDFIPVCQDRWGFVIADVSGKGVSAALYMALCRTLIHANGGEQEDPAMAIRQANRQIYADGRSSMFITVFYAILDPRQKMFSYVNAGHNPPLLFRDDPPVAQAMEGRGIALGVIEDVDMPATQVALHSGDLVVMYTDGVTEAFNEKEEYFGEERLIASVSRNCSRPVEEILDLLLRDIREFCGAAPQSDDITVVLIRVP
jgi:sigma-B regulation protein RsbU (phosphoserine phosphatase)